MWIAKKNFGTYKKGDEVKEEDAKRYGSLYCAKSGDAVKVTANNEHAETETTEPPAEIITEHAETETTEPPAEIITEHAETETTAKPKKKK